LMLVMYVKIFLHSAAKVLFSFEKCKKKVKFFILGSNIRMNALLGIMQEQSVRKLPSAKRK
jgi:hypothetical protein